MNMKQAFVGILMTGCLIGAVVLLPSVGQAQDAKVKKAMEVLQSMAGNKMGPPKTEGIDAVAGKQVPAIYFGPTKMNTILTWLTMSQNKLAGRPRSLSRAVTSMSA
jgi:hypothetical protein